MLKWCFRSALVLLVFVAAAWAISRTICPNEAQRQAVAELERQPDYSGENAFALLMRGEFGMGANSTQILERPQSREGMTLLDRLLLPLFFDGEATVGLTAEGMRGLCGDAERKRLLADRRRMPEPRRPGMLRFACIGNPVGCMMSALGWPNFSDYRHRLQDYGAKLRVLGTLAWMRRHAGDGRSPAELLAARPGELKSPQHDVAFGPEGRSLRVPLYFTKRDEHWSIPLPPALYGPAAD